MSMTVKTGEGERLRGWAFFGAVFALAMAYVFLPVMTKWRVLMSPDDSPFYQINYRAQTIEAFWAGKIAVVPQRLFNLIDPVAMHDAAYVLSALLLGLSGVYYLRTRRVGWIAAAAGGLFLAFSGYIFTLFCAGHLGFFHLFSCSLWGLGLLNRCFDESRRWSDFALLGAVVMWPQTAQPDIWVLVVALLAVYALWRTVRQIRCGMTPKQVFGVVYPRFLLSVAVAGVLGFNGIRQVFSETLAHRDRQIAEATTGSVVAEKSAAADKQAAFDRWIFATNWSLPPEDCAEFLVPGIWGDNAFQPPYPYWGRLGRPYDFQAGKMMPNYRQHTVYLGLVTVLFGVFGVVGWWTGRRRPAPGEVEGADVSDVPFWMTVWIICLFLAMGRYTPFYRAFYALPYMDYLRAPVKFLHFTEVATALLAGFGVQTLVSDNLSMRLRRGFAWGVAGLAGVLGIAALVVSVNGPAIERHIAGLGLGQFGSVLRAYSVYNCWRATGIAIVAALVCWLAMRRVAAGRGVVGLVACLVVLGIADQAVVARRYVMPIDVRAFHEPHRIVREILKRTDGRPANVANHLTRNVWGQEWFSTSLTANGLLNVVPDPSNGSARERPFAEAFQSDPLRFWQVLGVRFVLFPRKGIEPFVRQGVLIPLCEFELGAGTIRPAGSGGDVAVLAELRDAGLPRVHFAWTGDVASEQQIAAACVKGQLLPVTDAPASSLQRPSQPVAFDQMRGERGVLVTRGTFELPERGLLVWNEPYAPDSEAFVDGCQVPLRKVDGLWCGVELPSGKHTVECRMVRRPFWSLAALALSVAVLLAGAWSTARRIAG